jgi:hypothetical protein
MKIEVVCKENRLKDLLGIHLIDYDKAIQLAFGKIEQNQVISSWKDALTSNTLLEGISRYIEVPEKGCFKDFREVKIEEKDNKQILDNIFSIGGSKGWYYADWLWEIRGFLDKLSGGVGLRRGRKSPTEIVAGETLDFWRVLLASREEKRLLLYAEMKLPGEAWLEFKIVSGVLRQTATFRPLGLWGRFYWYTVLPFHGFIFRGMIRNISRSRK